MNTKPVTSTFIHSFFRFTGYLEMASLALFVTGIFLKMSGKQTDLIFMISLLGLSGIYFLSAYKPPAESPDDTTEQRGFPELLSQQILPKLGHIAMSISLIGILFEILRVEGGKLMLMIGGLTSVGALVVLGILAVAGAKDLSKVFPLVIRMVVVLGATAYFYFQVTG